MLDYPSGWGIAAPSRTFTKELRDRWPDVTAVELSDRTSRGELDLVRAMAPRYDAIVASVFVRTASYSGRMDLAPPVAQLLRDLVPVTEASGAPYVAVLFGNPYVATFLPELPADAADLRLLRPARAIGRAVRWRARRPSRGVCPIALPGLFPLGEGLMRPGQE